MPTSREELHQLVEQLPPETVDAVGRALMAATASVMAATQRNQARLAPFMKLPAEQELSPEDTTELLNAVDEMVALATRMRDFEWLSPDLPKQVVALQSTAIELAARLRLRVGAWDQIEAAHRRGEISDPWLLTFLEAPEDDEPTTPEEEADVDQGREDIRAGRTRPWEDIRRELEAEAANGWMPWRIQVTARAERDLRSLPRTDQIAVRQAIDSLATDPSSVDLKSWAGVDPNGAFG